MTGRRESGRASESWASALLYLQSRSRSLRPIDRGQQRSVADHRHMRVGAGLVLGPSGQQRDAPRAEHCMLGVSPPLRAQRETCMQLAGAGSMSFDCAHHIY